ncbi:uncharacterized protein K452DRAFT_272001 [Aplosporella prunicola CBS 121167]|uniref:LisH domain-containing protein n=1 Tax=Aplosporella prunicola CBS 121167 TaxID=1176127 RepID=A0A6A6BDH9_9PEZI|nr:uncharacterized protein K452DRAFT_272001 [Aplosporella prunicola CBS 121167]KAF2141284.1 hypothetical protein K452DRAFT_272001 [Aplosporella prunicola CBS 121167]
MTTEHLSSNVVNYLVWRYLQEAGFAKAAKDLEYDWYDEPESLPFASKVNTHMLVRMLQDALCFDELRASASKGTEPRQYVFGHDHGRPFARYNGEAHRRKTSIDRRERRNDVNGLANGATTDGGASTPARKRKKPHGAPRVNGDMEVDTNGALVQHNESETVMSDAESPVDEDVPMVTTLSLGESNALQTEKLADLGPQTTFLRITEPDKTLIHTEWNPTEPQILLTAGESLLRMYMVPSSTQGDAANEPRSQDLEIGLNNFTITALAWTLPGEAVIGTLEDMTADNGQKMSKGKIVHLSPDAKGFQPRLVTSVLGSVFALRYNAPANLVLSVSSTDTDSSISVWKELRQEPLCTRQTDKPVFAAEWMSDTTFVVAGYGILETYSINPDNKLTLKKSYATSVHWENLRYDPVCDIIACSSGDRPQLGLILSGDDEVRTHSLEGEDITGLEFQPLANPSSHRPEDPRLLATSSDTGFWTIQFWNAKKPFEPLQKFTSGSVVEIAFSPDGYLLAAAGTDTVTFWDPNAGISKATWMPREENKEKWDTTLPETRETELDHGLRWDADGKKLAYKLGNQVSIVRVRP